MKKADWDSLRASYGEAVTEFLKNNNVIPERTASGAFKIRDSGCLTVCSKLATVQSYNEKIIKRPKNAPSPLDNVAKDCYDLPVNYERIVNIENEKIPKTDPIKNHSIGHPSIATNMKICLEDLCQMPMNIEDLKFFNLKNLRPDQSWNYENTFKRIMKTNIGRENIVGYENCVKAIKPILKDFQRKHNKFKYYNFLEATMKEDSRKKHGPQVSLHQLQKYFFQIFASVIPLSMFGSSSNIKKIRAGLKKCFVTSWGEKISLKYFVFSMKISDIAWLRTIKHESTRWCVISKMTKWLFETFFILIFTTILTISKDLYSEKKIILNAQRWKNAESCYIQTQQSEGSVVKISSDRDNSISKKVPVGSLFLHPRKNGVRPIYRIQYPKFTSDEVAMIKALMQQLFEQRYNCTTINKLHSELRKYAKSDDENDKQKVYLVSSDVMDAYGSVVQTKLYDIVNGMLNDIPHEDLTLAWLAVLKPPMKWQKNTIEYKCWFSSCGKSLPIKSRLLIAPVEDEQHRKQLKSKELIRSLIRAHILEQTFHGKKYALKKGVAQGSRLSAVLTDIYYSHMTLEEFGRFMKSGTLARFVDDFLYITNDKEATKEYLEIIKKGSPEYQCRFKASKTQTTVKSRYFKSSTVVTYLGYEIDSTSMNITPVYEPWKLQYVKTIQQCRYKNDVESFFHRLDNFASLKLTKIVLDAKINSQETILSTVKSAALMMSLRCVILLTNMFDRMEQHVSVIWEKIRATVRRLTDIFIRNIFQYKGKKRKDMVMKIKITIWKCILRVFSRNVKLRFHFGHDIKRMIKNETGL